MIYSFLKPIIHFYFPVFFRKIYITGQENLIRNKSIIFAVNHPTAFLDPIVVASMMKSTTHFMLRGDIFTSPIIRWLLDQIKTIPIFRFRDGFSALKNNQGTFEIVYQKLHGGANILILAEGQTRHEKKMRPIQKGAARMVFGAYEKYQDLDAVIIPVGVNYTDSDAFRSMIMVDYGKAIPVNKYYELHGENPRKAIKQLTEEISDAMYERIIHINEDADAKFVNVLLDINRHNKHHSVLPRIANDRELLDQEKHITETINKMEAAPKQALHDRVMAYSAKLKKVNVQDVGIAQKERYNWINSLLLLFGLLPFTIGFLANILPLKLGRLVADAKVTKIEFHSSVRFAVGMISYLFYFLIIFIIASINWGWMGFLFVVLIPLFGQFSLHYRDFYLSWKAARGAAVLSESQVADLRQERNSLLQKVRSAK